MDCVGNQRTLFLKGKTKDYSNNDLKFYADKIVDIINNNDITHLSWDGDEIKNNPSSGEMKNDDNHSFVDVVYKIIDHDYLKSVLRPLKIRIPWSSDDAIEKLQNMLGNKAEVEMCNSLFYNKNTRNESWGNWKRTVNEVEDAAAAQKVENPEEIVNDFSEENIRQQLLGYSFGDDGAFPNGPVSASVLMDVYNFRPLFEDLESGDDGRYASFGLMNVLSQIDYLQPNGSKIYYLGTPKSGGAAEREKNVWDESNPDLVFVETIPINGGMRKKKKTRKKRKKMKKNKKKRKTKNKFKSLKSGGKKRSIGKSTRKIKRKIKRKKRMK